MTKLEDLRIQMEQINFKMSDDMLMIHVINNLPEEYEALVESLGRRIDITGNSNDALTIEEMMSELSLTYERMLTRKHEAKGGKYKEEHALYMQELNSRGSVTIAGNTDIESETAGKKDPSKKNQNINNN
jgi:3-dehydroquinate dehydratase